MLRLLAGLAASGLIALFAAPRPAHANFGGSGGGQQWADYRPPDIRMRWIDPYGKLMPLDWPVITRWEWVDSPQRLPVKVPVLRTWVQLPRGYELAQFQSSNMVHVVDPYEVPFSPGDGEIITFDTQAIVAKGNLVVRDPERKIKEYGVLLEPSFIEATIMTHDSCLDFWVEIMRKQGKARYLYNAISCDITEKNELDIYVFFSPDARWDGSQFRGALTKGQGWIRYRMPLPRVDRKVVLGYVRVNHASGSKDSATVQRVVFNGVEASRRWRINVGLGATLMSYTEQPFEYEVTDIAMTAKVVVNYVLVPEKFEFSTNLFGTVLTLTHDSTPSNLKAPRFLGINMRMGYQFPGQLLGGKWQALLGWYIWTMHVPSKQYGINLLSGPQVFLLYRTSHRRSRNFFVYAKYAPIVDNLDNFSTSNSETAIGGGYQITRPGSRSPMFANLDFSTASFKAFQKVNDMTLNTVSLGVSWNL
ncbi:MAG: hypothetical protein IT285_11555 [Bdellovibrionales bacterium]|nr:hypothetical protein [Bdellovibrionales bacterium]